jgi:hypothetical protein
VSYVVITPEGEFTEHESLPTLEELQELVGGRVETHTLMREGEAATLWCAEEGKRRGDPMNARATRLAHDWRGIRPRDHIVGTVVLTGPGDDEGDMTSLSERWADYLRSR